ncbi:hypothetical protein PFICI_08134 [Pestalotiopsis fici W106-1]|uniref:EKC/KEOPS complex subunit BUD32 n=1 Tax=Pestalotiopsis fici (strain W106-1 / CGMCC3.15140) TaxID=1229662 RepID=W3X3F0_PESFW|nr:uncharacterized protein PFICI_08134 [Pestalotiopsis fici W106-1]ETS80605.1 hypothetical protein PFICI_08134 [Pestalotiopsis fici W106-1]
MARRYIPLGLDNFEDIEEYRPGGYHPVHLGDILDGRYRILHKLGSGGFSTTWLARDNVGYHALKILKAEETELSTELQTLERLARLQAVHPKDSHVRHLIDHFVVQGPNGQHDCLVTEVAGPSIYELYNVPGHGYAAGARRLRVDIARKIIRQVVEAVHFLHSLEICHGDLTPSNVLLSLRSMTDWTEAEVYERFGTPSTVKLVKASKSSSDNSAPEYVVEPASMPDAKYFTHDALLVDFGESFPFSKPPSPGDIGIPVRYRAPETIFESKLTPASEAWSLACVLFEFRAGNPLFTSILGSKDEIIQQMVQMKGKLPDQWWKSWDKRSMCFDEDGKPLKEWPNGIPMAVEYPIEEMVADIGSEDDEAAMFGSVMSMLEPMGTRVPEDEAENMKDFLNGVLKWSPDQRWSITHILQHPWISGHNGPISTASYSNADQP